MTAFLEIYLSSFWAWAGITWGAGVVLHGFAVIIAAIRGDAR